MPPGPPVTITSLPDTLLVRCLAHLSQQDRWDMQQPAHTKTRVGSPQPQRRCAPTARAPVARFRQSPAHRPLPPAPLLCRFRSASLVCKHWRALCCGSPELLRNVNVSLCSSQRPALPRLRALAAWLDAAGAHVTDLELAIDPTDDEHQLIMLELRVQSGSEAQMLVAHCSYACPALQRLALDATFALRAPQLDPAAGLGLRTLVLSSDRKLTVLPLGRLTNLQELQLRGCHISGVRGLVQLPPSLIKLQFFELCDDEYYEWPGFSAEVAEELSSSLPFEHVSMCGPGEAGAPCARCTHLPACLPACLPAWLACSSMQAASGVLKPPCAPLADPMLQVEQLQRLQCLELDRLVCPSAAYQCLTAPTELTRLQLQHCAALPKCLGSLPSLRHLSCLIGQGGDAAEGYLELQAALPQLQQQLTLLAIQYQ